MLKLKKVRWRNFLSTGQHFTEIDFSTHRTTLITGTNGSGKSTLIDALTFGLFGKPYRAINLSQLVNTINKKDARVEVEFDSKGHSYKIVRGIQPKVFEVWKDGTQVNQEAHARTQQTGIEEQIIGMNHRSFTQLVVLGSANYIPFMRLTAADRRSVVESVLDIDVFSEMNAEIKARISQNKQQLTELDREIGILKERLLGWKRQKEALATETNDRISSYEKEIVEIESKIVTLEAEAAEAKERFKQSQSQEPNPEEYQEALDRISEAQTKIGQCAGKLSDIKKDMGFYEANDNCPTCNHPIDPELKSKKIEDGHATIQKLTAAQDILKSRIQDAQGIVSKHQKAKEQTAKEKSALTNIQTKIDGEKNRVERVRKSIEEIRNRKPVSIDEEAIRQTGSEWKAKGEDREGVVEERGCLDVVATLLNDGGIKTKIVRHYIPIINQTVNRMLNHMGLFAQFELDDKFNETIRSRHRDSFTYESFSEGEKRKIDLAIMFAWRTIARLKSSVDSNLILMDEILDGSLDQQSIEYFFDIMKSELPQETHIVVISHKPKELISDKFDRSLSFSKRENFSEMSG